MTTDGGGWTLIAIGLQSESTSNPSSNTTTTPKINGSDVLLSKYR
jgi:hypothetical protein